MLVIISNRAVGQAFLFPGASSSFESGLSQTNTRGAVAVATNPANTLITKRIEAYGDLSLVNVNYSYQRPDYAPAKIAVTAPPVNFGGSFKPKSNLAVGLLITPRPALSAQKIQSVPTVISGSIVEVDIEQKSSTIITAIGAAYKANAKLSLGISMVELAEDTQIIVRQQGTTDDQNALVGMRYKSDFFQFIIGGRYLLNKTTTIAGSLKTPTSKSYKGTQIIKGDQDNSIKKKGYHPMVLAGGAEHRLGSRAIFGELRYETWASGQSSYSSGLPGSSDKTALNNIIVFIGGGRLRFPGGHAASASFGIYPHNVGFGSHTEDLASGSGVNGVQFGEFDALDRTMISASYRNSGKKRDFTVGFNFITGSRNVPDSYPGGGKYSLTVFTLGAGSSFFF